MIGMSFAFTTIYQLVFQDDLYRQNETVQFRKPIRLGENPLAVYVFCAYAWLGFHHTFTNR